MGTIPDNFVDLFQKKTFAQLATLMTDGSPQVTPVWCEFDGTHVVINSAKGRTKDLNMRRNPNVALSIQDPENPTGIFPLKAKWSRSRRMAQTRISTSWRRNTQAKMCTRIAGPVRCASFTRFSPKRFSPKSRNGKRGRSGDRLRISEVQAIRSLSSDLPPKAIDNRVEMVNCIGIRYIA